MCVCVRRRAGGGRRQAGVHNQKQKNHTKMWGRTHFVSANLPPADCFVKGMGWATSNTSNIQNLSPTSLYIIYLIYNHISYIYIYDIYISYVYIYIIYIYDIYIYMIYIYVYHIYIYISLGCNGMMFFRAVHGWLPR